MGRKVPRDSGWRPSKEGISRREPLIAPNNTAKLHLIRTEDLHGFGT